MIFTKFHENWSIIDGEINEKHALLVECGPGYKVISENDVNDNIITIWS